jgi:hypothetical protein
MNQDARIPVKTSGMKYDLGDKAFKIPLGSEPNFPQGPNVPEIMKIMLEAILIKNAYIIPLQERNNFSILIRKLHSLLNYFP